MGSRWKNISYAMTHVQVIHVGCKDYTGSDEAMYTAHTQMCTMWVGQLYLGGSIYKYASMSMYVNIFCNHVCIIYKYIYMYIVHIYVNVYCKDIYMYILYIYIYSIYIYSIYIYVPFCLLTCLYLYLSFHLSIYSRK